MSAVTVTTTHPSARIHAHTADEWSGVRLAIESTYDQATTVIEWDDEHEGLTALTRLHRELTEILTRAGYITAHDQSGDTA